MNVTSHSPESKGGEVHIEESVPDDLVLPMWSVISFDKCEGAGLTYAEAFAKLGALEDQGIAGLCIVTDNAAAIVGRGKS